MGRHKMKSKQINELEDLRVKSAPGKKPQKSEVVSAPKCLLGFLSQHISDQPANGLSAKPRKHLGLTLLTYFSHSVISHKAMPMPTFNDSRIHLSFSTPLTLHAEMITCCPFTAAFP